MSFNSVRSELAVLACACSLLLPIAASAREQSVWFSIGAMRNGQLSIDPIATVAEHKLVDTPDPCAENDSEYVSFADRYMKPGKSYQVLFGGVPDAESFSGGMKVQVICLLQWNTPGLFDHTYKLSRLPSLH